MNLLCCVLVVAVLAFSSAAGDSLILGLGQGQVALELGAPLQLDCGVEGHFRHCFWETPDGRIFQVQDVHAGRHAELRIPQNLTNNQCGVVVEQASAEHEGEWTCRVLLDSQALSGTLRIGRQTCQNPFVAVGTGCYYFSEMIGLPWEDARSFCQDLSPGADLAVLDDCYQFQMVWGHILVNYGVSNHWIGGHDEVLDGRFYWVDNTIMTMGTPFWFNKYPTGLEKCVAMSTWGGYYIDSACSNNWHFVCQQLP